MAEAGGLDSLFIETNTAAPGDEPKAGGKMLTINTVNGKQKPVEGRLFSATWSGENALVLMISTQAEDRDQTRGHFAAPARSRKTASSRRYSTPPPTVFW